jgi:acetolactate synthase-1/2/3 large subunit
VKHNFLVKRVEDVADTIKKAFYIASSGRPGPVVVDIPKDTTDPNVRIPYHYPEKIEMRSYSPVEKGHLGQIRKAVDMMLAAERPVIYTGGGVVLGEASGQLIELVRATGFPVTNTLMGLGAYPATDTQFIGMLGMHGTYEANMAMHETDVLIAIGARFDDRVTGALLSKRTDHSHRRRSGLDLKDRARGRADRRPGPQRAARYVAGTQGTPEKTGCGQAQDLVGAH